MKPHATLDSWSFSFRTKEDPEAEAEAESPHSGPVAECCLPKWNQLVCLSVLAILPGSLLGQESATAMLRTPGSGVLVNRNPARDSTALFFEDLVETPRGSIARIEANGSTADINPETMIQFEGDVLVLDHGSLSITTSRGLKVRVGCQIITPANNAEWTHYDVVDRDGKVTVSALKKDVNIDSRSNNPKQAKQSNARVTVSEGEKKSREENCGAAYPRSASATAGMGGMMNSPWTIGVGAGAIAALACIGFCHNDDPVSPTKP